MAPLHFIVNPVAGNGLSLKAYAQMEALLQEQTIPYTTAYSQYPGHASILAKEALERQEGCIVAVGGDGTVREVARELVNTGAVFSVLPCGTGNDMVRALHIPKEPAQVLHMLLNNPPRSMDAATANGELYLNVGGIGFDVDVLIYTEKYKTRFKGLVAYLLGLFRALFKLQLRKVRVTTPDAVYESNALVVTACNGTHFGGGMNVAPQADPFDGLLDICILNDVTVLTVIRVLAKFVKGKHLPLSVTHYFRATEITVESDPPSPMQLDGEIMSTTPVTFKILPAALRIIV